MSKKYICEGCGGCFESDQTDEEALAEFKRLYPNTEYTAANTAIVCDDCHLKIEELRRKFEPGSVLQ